MGVSWTIRLYGTRLGINDNNLPNVLQTISKKIPFEQHWNQTQTILSANLINTMEHLFLVYQYLWIECTQI